MPLPATRRSTLAALLSILALAPAAQVHAQAYPDRPVTLVVGYAAGGAIDQSARLLGQALSVRWGLPVVVENRAGANGTPAGTPAAVVQKLNTDINAIIQTAEFKSALEAQGNVAAQPVSPAQFAARLDAEMRAFEAVAAKIDLSAN